MKEDQGLVVSHTELSFAYEGVHELFFPSFFEVQEHALQKRH